MIKELHSSNVTRIDDNNEMIRGNKAAKVTRLVEDMKCSTK